MQSKLLLKKDKGQPSLKTMTAIGVALFATSSVVSKVFNIAVQLVLGWLLSQEDFGLIGLAYSFGCVGLIFQNAGLREVLLRGNRKLKYWERTAFWLAMTTSFCGALVTLGLAAIVYFVMDNALLALMISILAISYPMNSLAILPAIKLQREFRFTLLAALAPIKVLLTGGLTVALAYFGWGALSFVVPLPIVALLEAFLLLYVTDSLRLPAFGFRFWRYLLGSSGWVLIGDFADMVLRFADYAIIGIMCSTATVGVYYFAYNMSAQSFRLIATNLTRVVQVTLSNITKETDRQSRGFVKACKMMTFAGVPICILQAILARPVLNFLYEDKWNDAIILMQLLSVAIIPRLIAPLANCLIKSQGRFGLYGRVAIMNAILFLTLVTIGAYFSQAKGAAIAVLLYSAFLGPTMFAIGMNQGTFGGLKVYFDVYRRPLLASVVSLLTAAAIAATYSPEWREVAGAVTFSVVYLLMSCWLMPSLLHELLSQAFEIRKKFRRSNRPTLQETKT